MFKLPFIRQNAAEQKPRFYTYSIQYLEQTINDLFNKKTDRSEADIERNQKIYASGGLITTAINRYPEYMFMNLIDGDIELVGDNQNHVDVVYDAIEKYDFLTSSILQCQGSLVSGDGIAEIVKNKGGKFHSTVTRNPKNFDASVSKYAIIEKYKQTTHTGMMWKDVAIVEPEQIWHVRLLPQVESPWGMSLISYAIDEIKRDTVTAESIAHAIERHGTRKYDIIVGADGQEVNDNDLKAVAAAFKNIGAKKEFVHRQDVAINELDASSFGVQEYSETSLTRLFGALGVPSDLVIREGSSLATSDRTPKMKAFENTIKSMQTRFNIQTDHQLFRRIIDIETGEAPSSVRINFGDISKDDWLAKVDAISKLMPQIDPFQVFHRNEIREILGHGKYEDSDEFVEDGME